jgi:uncharacterized membrane protein YphA (DoxX/SURF4 family)
MNDQTSDTARNTLRWTYGLVPIAAGLDKFTNILTDWTHYLSPQLARDLPVSGSTFMHVVGVVEIIAGILVLSRFSRFGAYLVSAWLVAVAASLVVGGQYLDVAVRDLVIAVGAFTLAKLTAAQHQSAAIDERPALAHARAA